MLDRFAYRTIHAMKTTQTTLTLLGAVLLFFTGCSAIKDPAFWAELSQSNQQQAGGYYQPQPSPVPRPAVRSATTTDLLTRLEGCVIVAYDGQFLGRITVNEVALDSILNEVGRYGSEVSLTSIFNVVGKYGSEVSPLSPFNRVASTPPQIVNRSGQFVAYLTKNTVKTPAVDPHLLIGLLKSAR